MKKKWCLVIGILAVCAATLFYVGTREQIIPVNTITLESQAVEKTISCDGVVEAGETETILTDIPCYIDKVYAQKGMYVEKGQALARINKEATKVYGQLTQNEALKLSTMAEEIQAPQSGIILKLDITDGAWVDASTACAVIAPSDSIRVRVAIREKHLPQLHSGLSATVTGEGLQDDSYSGVLTEISSTAQSLDNGGTIVEGVIELTDAADDPSLRIGINVRAKIVVETVSDGIIIPYEAVGTSTDAQNFVYVLSDGAAVKYTIKDNDELSSGILVSDSGLVGQAVIMHPEDIDISDKVMYRAVEESE